MNSNEFRERGKQMVDYIADYMDNIKQRRVTPDVEPGYLRSLLPLDAPEVGETWDKVMQDVESHIMPGITHWQHPRFHAYFPAGNAYPSILADMLSSGLGIVGFSWAASPACTELETIVLDWLGKLMGLPKDLLPFEEEQQFDENMNSPLIKNQSKFTEPIERVENEEERDEEGDDSQYEFKPHCGGGVLLGTASECVLISMLSARRLAIQRFKKSLHGVCEDGTVLNKLVAYSSKLAHSCVEKAAMISLVKIRLLDVDEKYSLRGDTLAKAIEDDLRQGLVPFYVCATLGTTSCCSYDNLSEIGQVCLKHDLYLHVDAAYAGNALICDEFRVHMSGLHFADSINSCPNKWLLINFDCSCLWVRDKYCVTQALSVDPIYLQYKQMDKTIDYRHWGIALSRRFRSLKLWFTMKTYGVKGLQAYIREHVRLASIFEDCICKDDRFELVCERTLALVCFRLKGPDGLSKSLLYVLNDSGLIHMTPAMLNDKYMIRFSVNSQHANEQDMYAAWSIIQEAAEKILNDYKEKSQVFSLGSSDKFIEIDSSLVVDFSKMRRQCFTRMVSDPCKDTLAEKAAAAAAASVASLNESTYHLHMNNGALAKKRVHRLKTFQCNSADLRESIAEEMSNNSKTH